uniref:Uncharacterized protein n=1 Tax=Picocystis salinarum TaxID=88271 RepID=A0A7S3UFT1_9CHLO|mmetsp:Transcript_4967/g.31780  ORF Transcript_4967/g.31780 Transcript_4967/m.31780 type:complete len:362 (+) Transcript_4967:68-1153(+)
MANEWDAAEDVEECVEDEGKAECEEGIACGEEDEREVDDREPTDVDDEDEFGEFGAAEDVEDEEPQTSTTNGEKSKEAGRGIEDLLRMTKQERSEFLHDYFRAALGLTGFGVEKAGFERTPESTTLTDLIDEDWREKLSNPRAFLQNVRFDWEGSSLRKKLAKPSKDDRDETQARMQYEVEIETPNAHYLQTYPRAPSSRGSKNLVKNIFADEASMEPDRTTVDTRSSEAMRATTSDQEEEEDDDFYGPWSTAGESFGAPQTNGNRNEAEGTSFLDADLAYLEALGTGEDPSAQSGQLQKQQRSYGKNVFNELKNVHARKAKSWFGSSLEEAPAEDPFAASDLVPLRIISRKKEKDQSSDA